MPDSDEQIKDKAIAFARANKKQIARGLTNIAVFPADSIPVSVFMAGSPGAGKTESSKNLIARFSDGIKILRIDPDELREHIPNYTGSNSHLFQGATSIIADKMHDMALENRQSFIFDGTLTNLTRARDNITRSLSKGRKVYIVYVYQNPLQAWQFVKARERQDGRFVPKEAFIHEYFEARHNVNTLKSEFGKDIVVDLIVKNIDGSDLFFKGNVDNIDNHIPERYNIDTLQNSLHGIP